MNPSFSSSRVATGIAFRVDPGPVERVLAAADLEEAGGLGERRRADPLDLDQLLRGPVNGPFSLRCSTIRRAVSWFRPETCRSSGTLAVFRSTPTKLTQLRDDRLRATP